MTVSIIIAVKTWQKNLEECVAKCRELDYPDFEIIILPDHEIGDVGGAQVIPTGPLNPAKKRDMAVGSAKGDILAFIDDDAYPRKDWLKNAVVNFSDPDVAAVGGPAITAGNDDFMRKASGMVYSAPAVSGKYIYRYLPGKRAQIDDYPSCNFLVRRSIMLELGGFNTNFWPGEDTKLCLDITAGLGKKIIYDPAAVVYHHRRPLFLPHLKQIASYALHRGYFVKRYPHTSLKLAYFAPSLFSLGLLAGTVLSIIFTPLRAAYITGLFLYLFIILIFSISKELRFIPYIFCGIILTHLTYGFYFLKGLFTRRLKEESI
ncbi:MAG: glycosyltransferase [Candidatus Omnitrophota bacterium]|jgi:GT2 family glycosyltransferase